MTLAAGFVDLAEALNKSCLYMQQINWGWCVFMVETGTKSDVCGPGSNLFFKSHLKSLLVTHCHSDPRIASKSKVLFTFNPIISTW